MRERAQERVIGSRAEEGQLARSMLSVFRGCAQAGKGWVQDCAGQSWQRAAWLV